MLEEVAEGYLNELIERSLVQVVEATSDGRVKKCRIQGLLHDIITSMAKDQGFAAIAKEESMMLPERVRRLSIQNARTRIQRISQFTSASGLRSLLVFSGLDILPESPLFDLSPSNLRMLNVLELGGTQLEDFPNEVTNLLLLKYLSLRNTEVNYIPSSIGNLQYLETLDLKNSRVIELPNTILKLQKLRHILVYRYETKFADQMETKQTIGFKLPTHIRVLKWSWQSGDPLLSLQHLPSLVHVEFVQVYDGELLHFRAKGFRSLKFLGLNKLDRLREIIIEPGAMPFLQKLVVQNCGLLQRVPSGIEHLTHLRVLEFINMPVNLIVTLHPDRNDGDYLKIAEVPEVYFYTYWNNGDHIYSPYRTRDHIYSPIATNLAASSPASTVSASIGVETIDQGSSAIPPSMIPTKTGPPASHSEPFPSIFTNRKQQQA
ncbi:hypothetical protein GH714_027820 [Hevea brasiliensis]|uniref:Rx N-terminal domain-containing protein n=1 Tax=Hevea brasiliensis TaxID=3981 RepID=A0A6A6N6N5_HEVBR|nr:hypothetical protein GH714_027820 [Hevea brasiliensis]